MKFLVMSDSHGSTGILELVAQRIEQSDYDCIVHLGDMTDDAEWLEKRIGKKVISVAGNCDSGSFTARETVMNVGNIKILLSHADRYGVKYSLDRLSYHASEVGCAAAFFGHTHRSFAGYVGGVLLVNPGALMGGSCAEVNVDGMSIVPTIIRI